MEDILKQLYYGELDPSSESDLSPEDYHYYQKTKNKVRKQREYFKKKLSEDDVKQFDEMIDSMCGINNTSKYAGFSQGLKLGILLMLEIL